MKYSSNHMFLYLLLLFILSCSGYKDKYFDISKEYEELLAEKSSCEEEIARLEDEMDKIVAYVPIYPQDNTDILAIEDNLAATTKELEATRKSLQEMEEILSEYQNTENQTAEYQSIDNLESVEENQNETTAIQLDSILKLDNKQKSIEGYVSIYCPKTMREENSYNVFALVKPLSEENSVKKAILELVNETRRDLEEPEIEFEEIISDKINLHKYIKIELKDYSDKFTIVSPEGFPDQNTLVDIYDKEAENFSDDEFLWRWIVTPKENSYGKADLKFIITSLNEKKEVINEGRKERRITIDLKHSFLTSVWLRANRNPEWAIASIITPFLTFLAGFFVKKKREEKSGNSDIKEA